MRIMIHACPRRMWYVEGFLVPKLREQGFRKKDIEVWNDKDGLGNLESCMKAFEWCGAHDVGGTWHIQDDVLPAKDFAKRIESIKDDAPVIGAFRGRIVGSERRRRTQTYVANGYVKPADMWWFTFQCVRIADDLAGECAAWFRDEASHDERYKEKIKTGKLDDGFFWTFLVKKHEDMDVLQIQPSLVDHIANLIGGSTLTPGQEIRTVSFPDQGERAELEDWLAKNGR